MELVRPRGSALQLRFPPGVILVSIGLTVSNAVRLPQANAPRFDIRQEERYSLSLSKGYLDFGRPSTGSGNNLLLVRP
jgi:hypothetical protein